MNQSDHNKLHELKLTALEIIGDGWQGEVKYCKEDSKAFNLDDLMNLMDMIRINTKYLMFDTEATRREREYFKTLVEKESDNDQR